MRKSKINSGGKKKKKNIDKDALYRISFGLKNSDDGLNFNSNDEGNQMNIRDEEDYE